MTLYDSAGSVTALVIIVAPEYGYSQCSKKPQTPRSVNANIAALIASVKVLQVRASAFRKSRLTFGMTSSIGSEVGESNMTVRKFASAYLDQLLDPRSL